ncbi:PLP-dependent aminotransferase family protein [Orrella sp. JC864]
MRDSDATLVDQIADTLGRRIEDQGLRPGTRLPSIRDLARQLGVSRFTVVEAYDKLMARGLAESRRGAGFFVRARSNPLTVPAAAAHKGLAAPARLDLNWLLRSMFRETEQGGSMPGSCGLLPPSWLDEDLVNGAVRAVGRSSRAGLLGYGNPQGYLPLRQQIAAVLQAQEVPAHPEHNLLTTSGVTHGLDLVCRMLVRPGDTVLVEDPAWFVIFGRLHAYGARPLGVPRGPEGPDLARLEAMAARHKPKLFIINSAVHNPTGHTLSAGAAYEVLRLAERHDFQVVEDDTYADLHPGSPIRLATLDRLQRVILVGGYSKTLAASLRVGYIAAAPECVQKLTDLKMLAGLTSPELGERVVQRVLAGGQYRRHLERVRARVDDARLRCIKSLARLGIAPPSEPYAGMFVWADCGRDTEALTRAAADEGLLLAPGSLFSPEQAPGTFMRFSVMMADFRPAWQTLERLMQ